MFLSKWRGKLAKVEPRHLLHFMTLQRAMLWLQAPAASDFATLWIQASNDPILAAIGRLSSFHMRRRQNIL